MTAYEQRSYPGAAADTVLAADLALGGTAFSVTAGTGAGYPDGSGGPFFVIIDYDNSKAEKIRCSGRVNDTFTVAGTGGGRGQDGTTAIAHTAPAKVRACITATDVQETNRAAVNTIGRITSKGDLTPGTSANTTVRLVVGADGALLIADSTQAGGVRWTSTGIVLDATSSVGGVSGTSLAADRTAWTVDTTPTVSNGTNWTLAAGSYQRYKQIGKTVYVELWAKCGANNTAGQFLWTLPVTPRDVTQQTLVLGSFAYFGAAYHIGVVTPINSGSIVNFRVNGGTAQLGQGDGFFAAVGDVLSAQLVYESA